MFGAMIRAAERWRAIEFIDFERRQITADRQDLDQGYQADIDNPDRLLSVPEPHPIFQQLPNLTIGGA